MNDDVKPSPAALSAKPYLIAVILLTLLAYGRIVTHEFLAWDDNMMVAKHDILNPPTWESVAQVWKTPTLGLYTPMAYTLWAAVAAVSRVETADPEGVTLNPMVFHLLNVALHVGVVVVVFHLVLRLTRQFVPSADARATLIAATIGTCVFAVHPLQTEAVAWIAGMNNLLAGLFSLAAVLMYVRWRTAATRSWKPYALCLVLVLLGQFSKPTAIVTPIIIAAIDLLLLRRPLKQVAVAVLPMAAIVLPFVIVGRLVQPAEGVFAPPFPQRFMIVGDSLGFYVSKLLFPWPLLMEYSRSPRWVMDHGGQPLTWVAMAAFLLVAVLNFRRTWVLATMAIFVAGFAPVSGIASFNFQEYSTVADRYLYMATLGPALLVALLIAKYPRQATYAGGAVAVVLAGVAFVQAGYWHDNFSICNHTLSHNPASVAANTTIAYGYRRIDDEVSAERHYLAALKTRPSDAYANYNYGNLLYTTDRKAQALQHYRVAAEIGYEHPGLFSNYGRTLLETGQVNEAIDVLEHGLRLFPNNLMSRTIVGYAYLEKRRFRDAEAEFREILRQKPDDKMAQMGLARVQAARSQPPTP